MGLDMYLKGEKFHWHDKRKTEPKVDGYEISNIELAVGYWRKHPDLHGYIVNTFAKGVDNCQKIELSDDDILKILEAVRSDSLPHTEGFFFGTSLPEDKEPTIEILEAALCWVRTKEPGVSRSLYYQASW